ncbi:MAG: DUF1573 domain-containing protein [Bacteroidales bacterium]|nr:DUF1573 domain-containing protein [Bacteroidales bacterium]
MKKLFLISIMAMFTVAGFAQKPVITFDKTVHDFGVVNMEDGDVTTVFTYTNTGDAPLILTQKPSSTCGCTIPDPKPAINTPIAPGESGEISVKYAAATRPGPINKSITVYSNAGDNVVLQIKGRVDKKAVAEQAQ